ncbi:MAG: Hsp20/alpha crystallin family protein, partial [Bdellovibrionales bacterium]|nr:Hsp20/alpha crystallin family protein [Bdellovibrionales bacterium]
MTWQQIVPWYGTTNPVVRRKPSRAFSDVGSFFDNFFDDFFNELPTKGNGASFNFVPTLNVENSEDAYRVTVEVPGVKKDDIHIAVEDNNLIISGDKKEDFDQSENKTHYIGRSYSKFERRIPFSTEVDRDAVTAEMDNGVLAIVLP